MSNNMQIKPHHIEITNTTKYCKTIKLCGVIIAKLDWMDESDGILSHRHVIDNVLPAHETYYAGQISDTNIYGCFDGTTNNATVLQSEIDAGDEPHGFHPYLKIEVIKGFIRTTKMDGQYIAARR